MSPTKGLHEHEQQPGAEAVLPAVSFRGSGRVRTDGVARQHVVADGRAIVTLRPACRPAERPLNLLHRPRRPPPP